MNTGHRVEPEGEAAPARQGAARGSQRPARDGVAASDPRLDWLYAQIAQLDAVDRSLALLMLDGFSYREMAGILGITENYVGVKISRIKMALAAKLATKA